MSLPSAKFVGHFSPNSSTSRYWNLWSRCDVRDTWRCGLERLKKKVYNNPAGCSISGSISLRNATTTVQYYFMY